MSYELTHIHIHLNALTCADGRIRATAAELDALIAALQEVKNRGPYRTAEEAKEEVL